MSRARRHLALAVAVAVTTSGCSLALVRRPSAHATGEHWEPCTEVPLWPALDGAYAVLAAVGLVTALAAPEQFGDDSGVFRIVAVPIYGSLIAGFGYAAWTRYNDTRVCKTLHERYEEKAAAGLPAPTR